MNIALGLRHPESDHKQEISLLFFAEWLTQCHFSTWCLRAMFQDHDQWPWKFRMCVLYRSQFKQRKWKNSEKEGSVECHITSGLDLAEQLSSPHTSESHQASHAHDHQYIIGHNYWNLIQIYHDTRKKIEFWFETIVIPACPPEKIWVKFEKIWVKFEKIWVKFENIWVKFEKIRVKFEFWFETIVIPACPPEKMRVKFKKIWVKFEEEKNEWNLKR